MIALIGGSGYVGSAYQRYLVKHEMQFTVISRRDCDYTNAATLTSALRAMRAEFAINVAGFTGKPNVDACELRKHECLFANAVLPGIIARACNDAGIPWGHVSSGCIYNGSTVASGFDETSTPNFTFRTNNCSFYSGTKALGEEILASAESVYVWRLRVPFWNRDEPRNYISKVLLYQRLLDVRNSLSQLDEFSHATVESWVRRIPFGTYNVTNPGSVTTREVAAMTRGAGLTSKSFDFFEDEAEFMRVAAKAPRSSCVLNASKLAATGITLTEVHEALERDMRAWKRAA